METPVSTPVPERERIESIDVLRGFALLGILTMNIQSFSMIGTAYVNPYTYGDMTGANYWVWFLGHLFADQKFMSIFSMLFGAGIVLMTGRRESDTGRSAGVHYRRMGVLLGFGLIHAYCFWYGDILVAYALCGMMVYLLRRLPVWLLVTLGLLSIAVHTGINTFFYWSMKHWGQEGIDNFTRGMNPTPSDVQKELDIYRGGWLTQMPHRAMAALVFETFMFGFLFVWRVVGMMLIGMALFREGVFSGKRSAGLYAAMAVVGLAVGIPIIIRGNQLNESCQWDAGYMLFVGGEYNYWGSIFVALAYVGLVMLACKMARLAPLAAVGRMALTNYLMHTLICTTLFYGHGFGQFGRVERVGQLGIVVAIWLVQLIVSPLWLRHFQFGPAEWLWRALTYWQWPPMRRTS